MKTNDFKHADKAQHAFSSDQGPSLHLALPVLKALHKAWSTRASNLKYEPFYEALEAGTEKINVYYQKTADSDAYIFAMRMFFISQAICIVL